MDNAKHSTGPVESGRGADGRQPGPLLDGHGRASIRFETGTTTHLRRLRRWLELLLGDSATVDVQLVMSELATNAFEHGSGPVEIEVEHRHDLRLRVTNRAEQAPVIKDQTSTGARGRGLAIVAATTSEMSLEFTDGVAVVACAFAGRRHGVG